LSWVFCLGSLVVLLVVLWVHLFCGGSEPKTKSQTTGSQASNVVPSALQRSVPSSRRPGRPLSSSSSSSFFSMVMRSPENQERLV
jgi:hypothetical protein